MTENMILDTEITSKPAVMQAAKHFARALAETPQFQAFEQAYIDFRQDKEAQTAYREFLEKQESLRAMMMLNAVSDEDQQALQILQERFNQQPNVRKYLLAQEALMEISQLIADRLSKQIGLNYASVCGTGACCG